MADLDVSEQRLLGLLLEAAESASLEFVGDCDLTSRRDVVELATEIGALAARGGAVVVGVDDHGRATGMLDEPKVGHFDEANLQNLLGRYLPLSVDLRVGRHQLDGQWVVLIQIEAHPDGAVVFTANGAFERKGKQQTAFRAGEFFVRHGTKSELPNQDDIKRLVRAAVEHERLWIDELHRVEEAVSEIGRVAEAEAGGEPTARIAGYGFVSRLPTARKRLAGRLAALAHTGGPELPQSQELALGSTLIFYNQVVSAVFMAVDEIARTFETQTRD
jgi:schlafen family protein